jgi:cyclomaltodextrinase / maltogenic alpha-amylase / neopullulanase
MRDNSSVTRRMIGVAARAALSRLALAVVLLSAPCAADESPIALRTSGGEAWSFEKLIETSVPAGACDTLAITSPLGTVTVQAKSTQLVARVPLGPGDNVVEAECRKDGVRRGTPAQQRWLVRLKDAPKAWVRTLVAGADVTLDAGASELAPARAAPIVALEWRARAGNPAPLSGLPARDKQIVLQPPAVDGEYFVTLRATDELGRADESTATFRVRNGKPETVDLLREQPVWIDSAVVYGVVPSFFGPHGLQDVTARLDELARLGVNTLWFLPITATLPGEFGYEVTDHFRLREDIGSEVDLRNLIKEAHARRMRVIMDFVPNHVSEGHPYFTDTEARGRASPYFDFFDRTPTGDVTHYFGWEHLENLNFDNPEVQRLVIEAFAHWVREFDIDGFRVDVAWGPRQRAPEFWPRWREELKRIKPDLLLLAEASARDPYYFRNGFDVAYDWTDQLGEWAWSEAFKDKARIARRLRAAITIPDPLIDPDALIFRFLNNNDTEERFVTRYGPDRTRVAAAMLLTLPGVPSFFTGDEVGAEYKPYEQEGPINWRGAHDMRAWLTRLLELRRDHPALRSRELRWLDIAPADHVLAYLRPAAKASDGVLVLLNYGSAPLRITLPGEALRTIAAGSKLIDLLHDQQLMLRSNRSTILLPGYGVRILKAS